MDGELTFDGELIGGEEVNELRDDICPKCGNDKGHNGGECRAKFTRCHNCNKLGHFQRMCVAGARTGAATNTDVKLTTTPAQDRFRKKQMRKKFNNKEIHVIENSDSESEGEARNNSEKEFGVAFEESDSESELREIFKLFS